MAVVTRRPYGEPDGPEDVGGILPKNTCAGPGHTREIPGGEPAGAEHTRGVHAIDARLFDGSTALAPSRHLRPLFQHERDHVVDDWAARVFHDHLVLAARAQCLLDAEIGRGLARLHALDGYIQLGYSRRADYVRETLGIGVRWAEKLVRLAGVLDAFPELETALATGELSTSKVIAIAGVVTRRNVTAWRAFARESTVRVIHAAVRAGSDPPNADDGAGAEEEAGARGAEEAGARGAEEAGARRAEAAAGATERAGAEPAPARPTHEDRDLSPLTIRAPAVVADLFDHAVEVARRAAGTNLPRREAFAYMLGELAATMDIDGHTDDPHGGGRGAAGGGPAGVMDDAADGHDGTDDLDATDATSNGAPRTIAALLHPPAPAARLRERRERFEAMLERCTHRWRYLRDPDVLVRLHPTLSSRPLPPDAFAIDDHLQRLVAVRQQRHVDLGALLYNFCLLGLPRKLHFASLGHYCRERLGLSARHAQEVTWAYRRFFRFKRVRDAYVGDEITWSQARLLLRVCRVDTQKAWIERARTTTFRRLELEVAAAARKREIDPRGWATDDGPPPASTEPPYGEHSPIRPGHGVWEAARTCSHRRWRNIRLMVPDETLGLWHRVVATLSGAHALSPPSEWRCLLETLRIFLETWETRAPRTLAERAVTRDGGCCAVPGCTSRSQPQAHHIILRSRPDSTDTLKNVISTCPTHHLIGIHGGRISCEGTADGDITWKLGIRTGHSPRRTYRGDLLVDRAASTASTTAASTTSADADRPAPPAGEHPPEEPPEEEPGG